MATTLRTKLKTVRRSRPFVLINMAMTADGKIATANRTLSSFGSPRDHEHLLALRATADAVMAGARTVDLNAVNLGTGPEKYRRQRRRRGLSDANLRIVVTGSGSLNPHAEIFHHRTSPLIILTTRRASAEKRKLLRTLADDVKVCGDKTINFPAALRWLADKWGVRRLLCEGGGALNSALFAAALVDELHLTVCPTIFGGRDAPTIADGLGAPTLAQATQLHLKSSRRVGDELFLTYRVHSRPQPARRANLD